MGADQSRRPAAFPPHDPLQTLLRELRAELGLVNQFASAEQRARAASTGSPSAARHGVQGIAVIAVIALIVLAVLVVQIRSDSVWCRRFLRG